MPSCVVTVTVYADGAAELAVSATTTFVLYSVTLYTTGSNSTVMCMAIEAEREDKQAFELKTC